MTSQEAAILDERAVFALWTTSSPAAKARYLREEAAGVPAYDPWPAYKEPRDLVVRCAGPGCGERLVATGRQGCRRRFCTDACRQTARYWRDPEHARALKRADEARRRARQEAA